MAVHALGRLGGGPQPLGHPAHARGLERRVGRRGGGRTGGPGHRLRRWRIDPGSGGLLWALRAQAPAGPGVADALPRALVWAERGRRGDAHRDGHGGLPGRRCRRRARRSRHPSTAGAAVRRVGPNAAGEAAGRRIARATGPAGVRLERGQASCARDRGPPALPGARRWSSRILPTASWSHSSCPVGCGGSTTTPRGWRAPSASSGARGTSPGSARSCPRRRWPARAAPKRHAGSGSGRSSTATTCCSPPRSRPSPNPPSCGGAQHSANRGRGRPPGQLLHALEHHGPAGGHRAGRLQPGRPAPHGPAGGPAERRGHAAVAGRANRDRAPLGRPPPPEP